MRIFVNKGSFNHFVVTKQIGAKKVFKMQVQKTQEPEQHFSNPV